MLAGRNAAAEDRSVAVVVVGPGAAPPASCWLRTETPRENQTIEVIRGIAKLPASSEPTQVLVYGAKDETGRPLPWAPFRGGFEPDATQLRVQMGRGIEIRGRVIDAAGAGVPGAAVAAHFLATRDEASAATAFTDAEGAFVLVGLDHHEFAVRARRKPTDIASALDLVPGGSGGAVLTLPPTKDVTLTIVDWRDRPVPGVSLGLYEVYTTGRAGSHGAGSRTHVAWVRTNSRGVARWKQLDASATYDLQVDAPAGRDDLAELEHRPWPAIDGRIMIPRGYVITGTVRDAQGKAVRANVIRHDSDGGWMSSPTAEDGTFELRQVPYGPTLLEVLPVDVTPDLIDAERVTRRVEVTPDRANVTLTLREEASAGLSPADATARRNITLAVRIVSPDGKPVWNAAVSYKAHDFAESSRALKGRAEVRTRGEAGTLRVFGARDEKGLPLALAPAERSVSASTREITVQLEPGVEIRGRVQDETGAPVAGLLVQAVIGGFYDFGPDSEARTQAEGAFQLIGLEARTYALRVPSPLTPWAVPADVPAPGGAVGVLITLRRSESPSLVVLDTADRPIVGATIVLYEVRLGEESTVVSWKESGRYVSGAKGEVLLPPADPGRPLYLRIEPPEHRDDLVAYDESFGHPRPWEPKSGPIRLARGFTVTGVVRDKAGKPVAATIWQSLTPGEVGESLAGMSLAGESKRDGTFRLRGLPYGPVRIFAQRSPFMDFGVPAGSKLVTPEAPTVELTVDD